MKRLTTDNPKDNIENALNLFYAKDQWTWVRGGGPAPDYADISLCDFVRMLVKANIPDAELPEDDDALSELMYAWLMDEPTTAEGIISLLYTAGWAFAELRHRLAHYEELEEQGRLVVPPCKVGDTVYHFCDDFGCILPYFVETFNIGFLDKDRNYWSWEANSHAEETDELLDEIDFDFDDIGKTVFLTREEAERALEGQK